MYAPRYFRENDRDRLCELIETTGIGLLITTDAAGKIMSTFAPMMLEHSHGEELRLVGHMARANAQWRSTPEGAEVVAIFMGAHAYITPTWYSEEPDVPTWNYRAVEVRGRFRLITETAAVRSLLDKSVNHFEGLVGYSWKLDDIDEQVIADFQRGVAAFAIDELNISGATKHSQDKAAGDRQQVIDGLLGCGRRDVAHDMEKTRSFD